MYMYRMAKHQNDVTLFFFLLRWGDSPKDDSLFNCCDLLPEADGLLPEDDLVVLFDPLVHARGTLSIIGALDALFEPVCLDLRVFLALSGPPDSLERFSIFKVDLRSLVSSNSDQGCRRNQVRMRTDMT